MGFWNLSLKHKPKSRETDLGPQNKFQILQWLDIPSGKLNVQVFWGHPFWLKKMLWCSCSQSQKTKPWKSTKNSQAAGSLVPAVSAQAPPAAAPFAVPSCRLSRRARRSKAPAKAGPVLRGQSCGVSCGLSNGQFVDFCWFFWGSFVLGLILCLFFWNMICVRMAHSYGFAGFTDQGWTIAKHRWGVHHCGPGGVDIFIYFLCGVIPCHFDGPFVCEHVQPIDFEEDQRSKHLKALTVSARSGEAKPSSKSARRWYPERG